MKALVLGIECPAHESAVERARRDFPDADAYVCSWTYPDAAPYVRVVKWVRGGISELARIPAYA